MILYFPYLCCRIRDQVSIVSESIQNEEKFEEICVIHEELIDSFLYMNDVLSLNIERINNLLLNSLLTFFILPTLCGGIVSAKESIRSINVALYGVNLMLNLCTHESVANMVTALFFLEKKSVEINRIINRAAISPLGYYLDFNEEMVKHRHDFADMVAKNISDGFVSSLMFCSDSKFPEVQKIYEKAADLTQFESHEEMLASMYKLLFDQMSNSEIAIVENFHENLSSALGIAVGTSDKSNEAPIKSIERLFKCEVSGNEVRDNLELFVQSRDDNLVLLTSFIYLTVMKSKGSKELKQEVRLGFVETSKENCNELGNGWIAKFVEEKENKPNEKEIYMLLNVPS